MRLDLTVRLDQHPLVVRTTIAEADQVLLLLVVLIITAGLPLVAVLFLQEHKVEVLAQDQEATVRLAVAVAHLVATALQVVAAARVEVTVRQAAVVVARPAVAAQVAAAAVAVAHLAVDLAGEVNRSHII